MPKEIRKFKHIVNDMLQHTIVIISILYIPQFYSKFLLYHIEDVSNRYINLVIWRTKYDPMSSIKYQILDCMVRVRIQVVHCKAVLLSMSSWSKIMQYSSNKPIETINIRTIIALYFVPPVWIEMFPSNSQQ